MTAAFIPQALPGEFTECMICDCETREYCSKNAFGANWRLRKCIKCGHGFVSNRPTLEQLKLIYATDAHQPIVEITVGSLETHPDARELAARICKLTSARGRSLDVGSGAGAFSYHLARSGFTPLMIDLDPRAELGARLVSNSSFRLCAFEEINEPASFDVIVMSQTLEHSLDPQSWLRHARALLTPDGVLAVALPNFTGLYRILGKKDPFINPPIHLNHFTPRSMRIAFEKSGLAVLNMRSENRVALCPAGQTATWKARLPRKAWNMLAKPLNLTTRGIILQAFGRPV